MEMRNCAVFHRDFGVGFSIGDDVQFETSRTPEMQASLAFSIDATGSPH
jgi:hypothetical protein